MKKNFITCLTFAAMLAQLPLAAQNSATPEWAKETPQQKQQRLAWWTDARFGMFIHWGLYSLPARHEWVQHNERIPDVEYGKYFDRFDPDLYDPAEWARKAREAGMKYVVLGTKHHEGFCLFDSRYTDFKSTNTPCGKDLVRLFCDAARAEGLRIGFYYSLIDWHHPDFEFDWMNPEDPCRKPGDCPARDSINRHRDMEKYRQYVKNQLTELLTGYGRIDELFLDFSYYEKGRRQWDSEGILRLVRSLQPQIIVDDRLDLNDVAWGWDFKSPEQTMPDEWPVWENPATKEKIRVPWETCQTFSGSWGYYRDETSWKSTRQLIAMLIEVVSKGGNLLLNVGPTARGAFDSRADARLESIGRWMAVNGRSIYGCTQAPDDFVRPENSLLTWNPATKTLYLHLFNWPTFKSLTLKGYSGKIKYAQLLSDASEIGFRAEGDDVVLSLPLMQPQSEIPVIELFTSPLP
jgi:alpha-L-fucosidase